MENSSGSQEDIFRPWKLSREEVFDSPEASTLFIDATPAWQHFEHLFSSRGYELQHHLNPEGDTRQERRRPAVDHDCGLGDPFKPNVTKPEPFVYHDPSGFAMANKYEPDPWLIRLCPRLIYAYDKYNRIVTIKVLPVPDEHSETEIMVMKALNYEPLRSCPENHSMPLLEHIPTDEGWHFLVMPAWRMKWEDCVKAWQVDEYLNVASQLLEGLAFMHKNGFAHGDMSIDNFLFNQDGTVLIDGLSLDPILSRWDFSVAIIDFGLSVRFDPTTDPSTWVSTNLRGTYKPPEQISAMESGIPYQVLPADIYALGTALKEILAIEEYILDKFRQFCSKYPVFAHQVLKQYVPEFEAMLNRMTDNDPVKRPTAEEALEHLKIVREALPNHIRFAPSEGYPASLIPKCNI